MTDWNTINTALVKDLKAERDEWRTLAQQLRAQEARISGVLCDVDWSSPDSMSSALDAIGELLGGPRRATTSAKPKDDPT